MRVSIKKNDPGYHKRAHLYQPYLNGEPVKDCVTADEDRGFVEVNVREGGMLIVEKGSSSCVTRKIYGKVVLKISE